MTDRPADPRPPPAVAREAASLLLAREGPDAPELFMLMRHHDSGFASGALVYPGGAVDEKDRNPALRARADGADQLDDSAFALRIAAIREAFEECGVLLARASGSREIITQARLDPIRRRFADALTTHSLDLHELALAEDLTLACDLLVPFAHWITPESQPKRFDTHFFLAPAPAEQQARHDGRESVDSTWIAPDALIRSADEGKWYVMFPTRLNAMKFGDSGDSVPAALAAAREAKVVTVMPHGEKVEGGRRLKIPAEAGYGFTEALVDRRGSVTRIV